MQFSKSRHKANYSTRAKLATLFILGTASILPTLWGTFIFDDGEAIVKNEDVISPATSSILQVFTHDFWGAKITHPQSHKSYRPLTTLTYRVDYQLWGENAFAFHLVNLLIHSVNCCLVYLFLRKCVSTFTKESSQKTASRSNGRVTTRAAGATAKVSPEVGIGIRKDDVCYWASILFCVHPIHTEPLGGLVGRADLLSALVFLLSYVLISEVPSLKTTFQLTLAGIVGSLFKENAIVIIIFYTGIHLLKHAWLRGINSRHVVFHSLALFFGVIFIQWRLWFQNGPPVFQPYDNPPVFAENLFTKVSSVLYIWILNAFLLICPIWLCYDWSMGCIPVIESPLDVRFGVLVVAIVGSMIFLYKSYQSKTILISLMISGTTFLPSSNLLVTVGFVIAERNLYIVSIGFCLLTAHILITKKRFSFLYFIIVLFFARSVQRSIQWTSQDKLFNAGLEVCPQNAKIHYNLGTVYGDLGDTSLAVQSYKKAIELREDYYQAMNNLGNILRTSGQIQEAEYWLRRAVRTKDDFPPAWMNLGIVLSQSNATEALDCYQRALQLRKRYPDCEYNIGNLYLDLGKSELAFESWQRAITLNPRHTQAWINIVVLLDQQDQLAEAQKWGLNATKFLRNDDTLQFLLGNIAGKLKQYDHAQKHFQNALNICLMEAKPIPAKYWANLGVLYHRWGKMLDAARCYEEALRVDPLLESARKNLEMLNSKH